MVSEAVRRDAREHPESFRRIADVIGGDVGKRMHELVDEEMNQASTDETQATVA